MQRILRTGIVVGTLGLQWISSAQPTVAQQQPLIKALDDIGSASREFQDFVALDAARKSEMLNAVLRNAEHVAGDKGSRYADEVTESILRLTGKRPVPDDSPPVDVVPAPTQLGAELFLDRASPIATWRSTPTTAHGIPSNGTRRIAALVPVAGAAQRYASRISEDATWRSNFLSFLSEDFGTPVMRAYGGFGSVDVKPGGFPACVAVRNSSQLTQGGSGVLIGPNVVLTAAHVIAGGFDDRVFVGTDVEDAQEVRVRTAIAHGGYGKRTTASGLEVHENDIGLLFLGEPLVNCTPLKLADRAQVDMLTKCRLVGYGLAISRNGEIGMPGIQRTAVLVKAATNPDLFPCNAEYEFIAGDNITDSCAGDSGGPVLIPIDGDGSGELVVAGLVSRGLPGGGFCSGGGGIYVIPRHFQAWIEETAASNQGTLSW
jgi:hypothetical protein